MTLYPRPFTLSATVLLLLCIAAVSCHKTANTDVIQNETVEVPDSMSLSYPDGQGWKTAYGYHLAYDPTTHTYTVEETDYTPAPLPLVKTCRRFYFSPDEKIVSKIFMQQYALHTGYPPTPLASMTLAFVQGPGDIAPSMMTVQTYQDIDGTQPVSLETFTIDHIDPPVSRPFDIRTSTRVPVLPLRNDVMDYRLQYRKDSLLAIQGDFDLKGDYFSTIAPGYAGLDAYFNTFILTRDSLCSQYTFDKTWQEFVPVGFEGYYRYHPVARKKMDFQYDAHSKALAAIFHRLDPAWFSPYKTMITGYTFDYTTPQRSSRTFFENTSSRYTDSVFTFNAAEDKAFYSAVTYQNIVTTDNQNRVTTLLKQPDAGTIQPVKYSFFYQ